MCENVKLTATVKALKHSTLVSLNTYLIFKIVSYMHKILTPLMLGRGIVELQLQGFGSQTGRADFKRIER